MMLPIQGLAHIGLPCRDIEHSIAFYQQLGFDVQQREQVAEATGNTLIAFLGCGHCCLELYQLPDRHTARVAGAVDHFALQVTDWSATLAQLEQLGIPLLVPPTETHYGVCYLMIEGPDGEKIEMSYRKTAS